MHDALQLAMCHEACIVPRTRIKHQTIHGGEAEPSPVCDGVSERHQML